MKENLFIQILKKIIKHLSILIKVLIKVFSTKLLMSSKMKQHLIQKQRMKKIDQDHLNNQIYPNKVIVKI